MKAEPSSVYVYRGPSREIPWREIKRAIGAQLESGVTLSLTITCKAIERTAPGKHGDQPLQRDECRAEIAGGASEMHRRATLADVAREAKVSTSTVSRVLNDYGATSHKARAQVAAAMRRIDYRPNEAARIMVQSKRGDAGQSTGIFAISEAPVSLKDETFSKHD